MDYVLSLVDAVRRPYYDEDVVDRLHFRWTVGLLCACATTIFTFTYVGNPIECWANGEWNLAWIEYANDLCFVESTYYATLTTELAASDVDRRAQFPLLSFYQWVPLILVAQALAFYFPYYLWTYGSRFFGLFLRPIITAAQSEAKRGSELSSLSRGRISRHIYNAFQSRRKPSDSTDTQCFTFVRLWRRLDHSLNARFGPHNLFVFYCAVKLLYIAVSYSQLVFVSRWLNLDFKWVLWFAFNRCPMSKLWERPASFPRIGMCDFEIRDLGPNVQRYTVQCVLRANVINERMFIGLWFWFGGLLIVGVVNLSQWVRLSIHSTQNFQFVRDLIVDGQQLNLDLKKQNEQKRNKKRKAKLAARLEVVARNYEQFKRELESSRSSTISDETDESSLSYGSTLSDSTLAGYQIGRFLDWSYERQLEFIEASTILEFDSIDGRKNASESESKNSEVENDQTDDFNSVSDFAFFIGADGLLLFRLMLEHSDLLVTAQVMAEVYEYFLLTRRDAKTTRFDE